MVDLENARLEVENCRNVLKQVERDANEALLSRDILFNERSQLVVQIEILILLSESSGDVPPPLLRLAAEHFALQREQAALHTKCDNAVREAERLRRELVRLARHARPAPNAEQSNVKV